MLNRAHPVRVVWTYSPLSISPTFPPASQPTNHWLRFSFSSFSSHSPSSGFFPGSFVFVLYCLSQLSCTFMGARLINNLCQIIPLCHNKLKLATYFPDSTLGLYLAFKFFIMAKSVSLVAHLEKCLLPVPQPNPHPPPFLYRFTG